MEYKKTLLQGTALITALAGAAISTQAQAQSFVFGNTTGVVTATAPQTPTVGSTTALSAQYNNNIDLAASIDSNTVTSATGGTIIGGPTTIEQNVMSASAIANQFSGASSTAAYAVDPSYAPTGGTVAIGASQLNGNDNAGTVTNIARLGQLGTTTGGTPATSASTGTYSTGTPTSIDFTISGANWTVTGTPPSGSGFTVGQVYTYDTSGTAPTLTLNGTGPNVLGTTTAAVTTSTLSTTYTFASTPTTVSTAGALLTVPATASYTPAVASTPGTTTGNLGNSITSVNGGIYGAPVNVNSNTMSASLTGNLNIAAISGGVPLTGLSTGTATLQIMGIASGAPVGAGSTAIRVLAPVSVSNVQQNITDTGTATALTGSVVNSLISATFDSATGFSAGTASVSSNTISATARANSAQPSVNLTAAQSPVFTGGASVVSAQGNDATASGATLTLTAENINSTLVIQSLTSGTLTQFTNSNAALNNNTVSSRAVLNDLTAANLTTASTLAAGGTRAASGTTSTLLISPTNTLNDLASGSASTSTTTMRVNTDYLNASLQNNNSVTANANVSNAIIGFFGGINNGTATLQGNAVNSTLYGNNAEQTTTLPMLGGTAQAVTAAYQNNLDVNLNATVAGTQLRISDTFAATSDLSTATYTTVATASAPSATPFTNASLTIGSATDSTLGNSVRSTVFGNNATVTTNVNRNSPGILDQASAAFQGTSSLPTGSVVTVGGATIATLVQNNTNTAVFSEITQPTVGSGNSIFQIDAYEGLSNGTATIGNNVMRATAAGNVGTASAIAGSATANVINGGVTVVTVQGNSGGEVFAGLGTNFSGLSSGTYTAVGGAASIGIGALTGTALANSTAQVVNNSFAAVAAGNSASGILTIPANSIATGNGVAGASLVNSSSPSANTAGYLVANSQTNSSTPVTATNLDSVTYAALLAAYPAAPFETVGTLGISAASITSLQLPSRMNVGATSFDNATATVSGNSMSTIAMGNAFDASVSGFVTPVPANGGTSSSLGLTNVQTNFATMVQSGNVGNGFIVSTADTAANATLGTSNGLGSTTTNSVLAVTSNTVSAAATGNTAVLAATGIAVQDSIGSAASTTATLQYTSAATQSSVGDVVISNSQANNFSVSSATSEILAVTSLNFFSVGWSNTASVPTGSVFRVESNNATANATANTASLSATLATGPAYSADVGLNNLQSNTGPATGSWMNVRAENSVAVFGAGVSAGSTGTTLSSLVDSSTISVSSNRVSANATANSATLAISAPSSVLVSGGAMTNNYTDSTGSEISAGMAALNNQSVTNLDVYAGNLTIGFRAVASASNSSVAVNSNTVDATARGNTATATIALPRVDGSAGANNTQTVSNSTVASTADTVAFAALSSFGSDTTNSPVSVSNNTVSGAATANNYTAVLSGLGQTGAAVNSDAGATITSSGAALSVQRTAGDIALVSSQSMNGAAATTTLSTISAGVNLTNAQTLNSPLDVNGNTITATSNGNVSAQSILANGPGAANSRGGFGISSGQAYGDGSTTTETASVITGVNIGVNVTSSTAMTASPVSISNNTVTASATANSSSLSTLFSTMRSAGSASSATMTADSSAGTGVAATADYVQVNSQSMSGSGSGLAGTAISNALVSGSTISTTLVNGATTNAPITLSNNAVTATANGNVTAMSMVLNADGLTSSNRGTAGIASRQTIDGAAITGSVTGQNISAVADGSGPGSYVVTTSPVALNNNTIGANATGNSATQNMGYASANRASGTGTVTSSSVASAASSSSNADYGLLNYQTMSNSAVAARTTGSNISFAGASSGGPVNLQGNLIYASAFGNSASMTMSGPQAGGSLQSTNYQSTTNTSVTAAITGSNIAASMASTASTSAPINVSGNTIRAVAVGNSVTNAIGR
jgi:hypothetical protein